MCCSVEESCTRRASFRQFGPRLFDALERHRKRRAQLLREQRDLELLEQPAERAELRRDAPRRLLALRALAIARPQLCKLRRMARIALRPLEVPQMASLERLQIPRH